jgi:hypothetical protein
MAELNVNNLSITGLGFGNKMDAPVCVSQEGGVVGLNFHQSREVLITDSINGSAFILNGAAQTMAPGLIGVDYDDLTDEMKTNCWSDITSKRKIRALLQKNFLRMWRNVGVMLFIFALPVMQVILFPAI